MSHVGAPRAIRYSPSSALIPPATRPHRLSLPPQHRPPPFVGYSSPLQPEREHFRSLLKDFLQRCKVKFEITPLDNDFYEECIEDAKRRGYPVDGVNSVRTFLPLGVSYAGTAGAHLSHRPTLTWIALYTSCSFFVDEISQRFPEEMPNMYRFNDKFIRGEPQGCAVLDAYADLNRRTSELYPPVASQLITASTLNYVAANLLEYETKSMKVCITVGDHRRYVTDAVANKVLEVAEEYPTYQRNLSGLAIAYAFMVFPREIPLADYIQAIPEMLPFINNLKCVGPSSHLLFAETC